MGIFNVRVYGILHLQDTASLLLSQETVLNERVLKFPGGGLQFGEGTKDALIREFHEELELNITIANHLYTTDFFQPSAFSKTEQLLAIYYNVILDRMSSSSLDEHLRKLHIRKKGERDEHFYRATIAELSPNDLTFPVDQYVVKQFICR